MRSSSSGERQVARLDDVLWEALKERCAPSRRWSGGFVCTEDDVREAVRSVLLIADIGAMKTVEPDARDIELLSTTELPRCPLCDSNAITIARFREDTGVYRGLVSCTGCGCEVGANYHTRDEARDAAIKKWSRRA